MHYLFLADLPHGKLVICGGRVEHEFVNNVLTRAERTAFTAIGDSWYNDARSARSRQNEAVRRGF